MRLISQLLNEILRVLEKLLKYFNGTFISILFALPSLGVFPVILILNFNNSECCIVSAGSSI